MVPRSRNARGLRTNYTLLASTARAWRVPPKKLEPSVEATQPQGLWLVRTTKTRRRTINVHDYVEPLRDRGAIKSPLWPLTYVVGCSHALKWQVSPLRGWWRPMVRLPPPLAPSVDGPTRARSFVWVTTQFDWLMIFLNVIFIMQESVKGNKVTIYNWPDSVWSWSNVCIILPFMDTIPPLVMSPGSQMWWRGQSPSAPHAKVWWSLT